jgi:hypothetical protein
MALYAVDVPQGFALATKSADYGRTLGTLADSIHTVSENPQAPVAATHVNSGADVRDLLSSADGQYVHLNNDNNSYEYQTLEIDLGAFSNESQAKLLVDHSVIFPSSAAGMSLRQTFGPRDKLEVIGSDGEWTQVPVTLATVPKPGEFQRTDVVDISGIFPTGDHRIRMTYLFESYIDRVAVDVTDDNAPTVTLLPMRSATLDGHGIDGVTAEEVYEYVYGEPNTSRAYFAGGFTRYGDVKPLLGAPDDRYIIFGGGDEVVARFEPATVPVASGMKRFYVLYSYGYYKGTTSGLSPVVGPLPFAGMTTYPYGTEERFPDDVDHLAYLAEYNTRVIAEATAAEAATLPARAFSTAGVLTDSTSFDLAMAAMGVEVAPHQVAAPTGGTMALASEPGALEYSVDTDQAVARVATVYGSIVDVPLSAGWQSTTASFASGPTPSAPGSAVDATTLARAGSRNGDYWRTDLTTTDGTVNWQLMRFDVPIPSWAIRSITLIWYGHGEPTPAYELKVEVWNASGSTWTTARNAVTGTNTEVSSTSQNAGLSAYCLRCHDGAPPAGVTFPTGVTTLAGWSQTTGDYHGGRSGTGFGGALAAGYSRGQELPCGTCHASHGSASIYHFPSSIDGVSVPTVTSGTDSAQLCSSCHVGSLSTLHQYGGCWCHDGATASHSQWPYPEIGTLDVYMGDCFDCHRHGASWTHTEEGLADCWTCGSDPFAHGSTPPAVARTF